jgi:hypothetical protein
MLLLNDTHRLRTDVASMDEPCTYSAKPFERVPTDHERLR